MGTKLYLIISVFLFSTLFVSGCKTKSTNVHIRFSNGTNDSLFVYKGGNLIIIQPQATDEAFRQYSTDKDIKPYVFFRPDSIISGSGEKYDFTFYDRDSLWLFSIPDRLRTDILYITLGIRDEHFY